MGSPRLALAVTLVAAACGPRLRYDLTLPEERATLDNGMRVVAMPDRTTDLVAIVVRYDVGAAHDPPGRAGLAHLVEHLTYLLRPGPRSILAEARERTVAVNAFTEVDSTRYVALAHPSQLEPLLRLEAARLTVPCTSITAVSLAREKAVIVEELRMRSTAFGRMHEAALASILGAAHPLARRVAADEETIAGLTLADACAFYAEHYGPERATLVMTGNLPPGALATASRLLAAAPRRGLAAAAAPPTALVSPAPLEELRLAGGVGSAVFAAWRVPDDVPEEILRFIVALLDGADDNVRRALRRAVMNEAEVLRVGGERYVVGSMVFPDDDGLAVGQDAFMFLNEQAHMSSGLELERLRYALLTGAYLEWQGLLPRAEAVARLVAASKGEPLGAHIRALRDLGPETINREMGRVLRRDRMALRIVKAERDDDDAPTRPTAPAAVARSFGELDDDSAPELPLDPRAIPAVGNDAAPSDLLPNGLRVVLVPRRSPFPVVSVRLVMPSGTAHALPGQDLVPSAAAALVRPATRSYRVSGGTIEGHAWHIAGARLRIAVTPDSTVVGADGLSDSLAQLLEGTEDWVTGSIPDDDDLVADVVAFMLRNLPTYADRATLDTLDRAVYGPSHPYARRNVPTPATVDQLDPKLLRAWQRQHYHAAGATLIVTGSFDRDEATALVRTIFGGWQGGISSPKVKRPASPRERSAFIALDAPTRTLDVSVAFATPPTSDDRRAAARLVLSEAMDRNVRALRERLGASYDVRSAFVPRVGPGMHVVHADVAPERAQQALDALRARLMGPTQEADLRRHFAASRRAAFARLAVEIDDCSTLADALAARPDEPQRAERVLALLPSLQPDEIVALAREEIAAAGAIVLVRGPRGVVDKLRIDGRGPRFVELLGDDQEPATPARAR